MKMGWLARQDGYDPNAFDVPLDQGTNVGWANRLGEILTTRPPDNPAVAYKTPYFDITEGDIGRATEVALGGMTVTPKGIKAYHSSPHDFDKFDLAKIGTGEGAQVYGHGLYFAESPAVSGQGGQYWQQFKNKFEGPERWAANYLEKAGFDRKEALEILKKEMWPPNSPSGLGAVELLKSGKPVGPRTYEVNIKADPAHMLDWDKPLKEMSPDVQRAFGKIVDRDIPAEPGWAKLTGEKALRAVGERAGVRGGGEQMLREAGIPGIKYLDQGSRLFSEPARMVEKYGSREAATEAAQKMYENAKTLNDINYYKDMVRQLSTPESSNYVVFDPGIIDIMKKYGLAGATAVPVMGSLASEGNYQTEERY